MLLVGVRLPFCALCIGTNLEKFVLLKAVVEERDVRSGWRVAMELKMVA